MLPPAFRAMDLDDDLAWLAVADWLEEDGQPDRAELTRLTRLLRHELDHPGRAAREDRLVELLVAGVEPCVAEMTNGVGMEFVYVAAGTFLMGSPPEEAELYEDEGPVHEVEITRGFWVGKYPVTQAEYQAVMGENPSSFSVNGNDKHKVEGLETGHFPVENVSYEKAVEFCARLSASGEEGRPYRLPSEAEWEYACRAGAGSRYPFCFGKTLSSFQANIDGEHFCGGAVKGPYLGRTSEVGSYSPNAFGLHDTHGNVWEWCADWYGEDYYRESGNERDPQGPQSGTNRVSRGGSWANDQSGCVAAIRIESVPTHGPCNCGFRVCFTG